MLDRLRSSILKCLDKDDCRHILFGGERLEPVKRRPMKNRALFPGIFCSTHPDEGKEALSHLRNSIHYFGFVVEKEYTENELAKKIMWFKNPN